MGEGKKGDPGNATGDCRRCGFYGSLNAKARGVRVPGGFGKCIRTGGHCDPKHPAIGIGGARSEWRPIGRDGGYEGK